jgi:AcrR family transcriptional regulator
MGRKRVIDRDAILDAAEDLTRERGAGNLTLDAVAKRAGISKGGLMYSFATKEALIGAIRDRDLGRFHALLSERAKDYPASRFAGLLARIDVTESENPLTSAKGASLMAALAQTPGHLGAIQEDYRKEMSRLDAKGDEGRRARLAMIAIEGAFLLRGLGLMTLSEAEWASIFADIRGLVPKD